MVAAYRQTYSPSWVAWSEVWQSSVIESAFIKFAWNRRQAGDDAHHSSDLPLGWSPSWGRDGSSHAEWDCGVSSPAGQATVEPSERSWASPSDQTSLPSWWPCQPDWSPPPTLQHASKAGQHLLSRTSMYRNDRQTLIYTAINTEIQLHMRNCFNSHFQDYPVCQLPLKSLKQIITFLTTQKWKFSVGVNISPHNLHVVVSG